MWIEKSHIASSVSTSLMFVHWWTKEERNESFSTSSNVTCDTWHMTLSQSSLGTNHHLKSQILRICPSIRSWIAFEDLKINNINYIWRSVYYQHHLKVRTSKTLRHQFRNKIKGSIHQQHFEPIIGCTPIISITNMNFDRSFEGQFIGSI